MKRLYSECSQEEDPQQLMTPDELAAQQQRVRTPCLAWKQKIKSMTNLTTDYMER